MKSGIVALFACLFAASCAGPGVSGSNSGRPDEWGHRPGPQAIIETQNVIDSIDLRVPVRMFRTSGCCSIPWLLV